MFKNAKNRENFQNLEDIRHILVTMHSKVQMLYMHAMHIYMGSVNANVPCAALHTTLAETRVGLTQDPSRDHRLTQLHTN